MDKFKTLEPVRLYTTTNNRLSYHGLPTSGSKSKHQGPTQFVGRLPSDLHLIVLQHLPVPDYSAYARCSHATAALADNEKIWEGKCKVLQVAGTGTNVGAGGTGNGSGNVGYSAILDQLEARMKTQNAVTKAALPPTIPVSSIDDEFGDFASSNQANDLLQPSLSQDEMGDFVGASGDAEFSSSPSMGFTSPPPSSFFDIASSKRSSMVTSLSFRSSQPLVTPSSSASAGLRLNQTPKETFKAKFIRTYKLLKPLLGALSSPPHLVLSELASYLNSASPKSPRVGLGANTASNAPSLRDQAKLLKLLSLFVSERIQPVREWKAQLISLRGAMDRFDATLLAAFDVADGKGDEKGMNEAAESSWEIWEGGSAAAAGRAAGVAGVGGSVGDWEMGKVWAEKREVFYEQSKWKPLDNFTKEGTLDFDAMDEFMNEILGAIGEHGSRAVRVFPPASQVLIFFAERLANEVVGEYITALLTRAREISTPVFLKATAASFREAWRMVDAIMQAAKQREDSMVSLTRAEDVVYQMFEANMDEYLDEEVEALKHAFEGICKAWDKQQTSSSTSRFLSAHNPAQVKRNVLASFTSVLLLPVTIVPRTVGAVGGAIASMGMNAGTQGIAMLNPQRWGSSNVAEAGYGGLGGEGGGRIGDEDDGEDNAVGVSKSSTRASLSSMDKPRLSSSSERNTVSGTGNGNAKTENEEEKLELLLSLDVALELIHADRDALKRVETFAGYPGHYGYRVRDTIEEVFILMLGYLGEQHVEKGFVRATERMTSYNPAEHETTTSVAPLLQFFELVHIGDMIQSMVQVYFEKELAPHIDKTDFLNAVVREKKKFENMLDDRVASGLNAGTELLMNQVEHIIQTRTQPREYYPPEDAPLDLGPTKGCLEAIKCLEMHCKLLKGSTSREVLEVFYQEVGIRLIAILQKHIKRQIISLNGGFQVIADLNTYHAFITSLKVQSIAADFSHLKMLGHVYVVEDAKDLAQIVRDVTRYGGAYRPEDIYEFIQRRSDWKKIEKVVDKTMYNLNIREDCVIA
ncbi:hypothetical protein AX16_004144 [Volvariella volvacea WC 439]|nr:hypothetical protein AX16_004144 [Volvariella volvacea WC 439]